MKAALRTYASGSLVDDLNRSLGREAVTGVYSRYVGNYEWTVGLELAEPARGGDQMVRLKFGPSAWFTDRHDPDWADDDRRLSGPIDYSRLLLAHDQRIAGSSVTMVEVLHGVPSGDVRLRDEVLSILKRGV